MVYVIRNHENIYSDHFFLGNSQTLHYTRPHLGSRLSHSTVMNCIVIEASSNEVCVRCYDTGKIIPPKELSISRELLKSLKAWFKQHKRLNHCNSVNYRDIDRFEKNGIRIAISIKKEIPGLNVHYQSDILMVDIGMFSKNIFR